MPLTKKATVKAGVLRLWTPDYIIMSIIVNLDVVLAQRKMKSKDLAMAIQITKANLSILKSGKARAIRFSTLAANCKELDCQPGDILEFRGTESDNTKL